MFTSWLHAQNSTASELFAFHTLCRRHRCSCQLVVDVCVAQIIEIIWRRLVSSKFFIADWTQFPPFNVRRQNTQLSTGDRTHCRPLSSSSSSSFYDFNFCINFRLGNWKLEKKKKTFFDNSFSTIFLFLFFLPSLLSSAPNLYWNGISCV